MRFATPLVHPASVLRGRPILGPVQVAYLRRLVSHGGSWEAPQDVAVPPPHCFPTPTLSRLRAFTQLVRLVHRTVVLDIENAGPHLICCGVLCLDEKQKPIEGACFRFRKQGGEPWWSTWEEHLEVVTLLDCILSDVTVTKVGHFIVQHDLPFLLDQGFEVNGPILDTSVLCHAVHSELPKGLQFLATLFVGAPRWKDIPDEKEATTATTAEESSDG